MGAGPSRTANPMPVSESSSSNEVVHKASGETEKTIQIKPTTILSHEQNSMGKEDIIGSYKTKEEAAKPQTSSSVQASKSKDEETASSSKMAKKPMEVAKKVPHMYKEIMKEADSGTVGEDIYSAGIYLKNKRKKYWVEEKTGSNCFMLFARDLSITWSEDHRYWQWSTMKETSNAEIEVPELLNVCWLELHGTFETSYLTPGITYEVVFLVMMKEPAYGWDTPVDLRLKFPNGSTHQVKELLQEKPRGQWIELKVGEFTAKREDAGEMEISLFEYEGAQWKRGLIIKGIILRPKK